ncbi:MAG: tRNA preQ1(34) S-adenosylmethionine ribosyltransferase-isomerase QueA [Cyanobacteria bacterium CRU_2_1]|nr:tRNA preQ1(34) S-adenosylmethionine ribosyltransferase-isomerase QueA [Cyanobacteria bacterium RU_5_0]NJR58458.1 tRNA preQ1(34) S-adenosylmethionine ribosyltransferase-isomerase QueA [Cyanobacteria bacterium CRU_2_1]
MSAPSEANVSLDRTLSAYNYHLPEDRIAQNPVVPRDRSRLLVVEVAPRYRHHIFRELPDLLQPGDLLILNNTRVIPARLYGRKGGGAKVEVLLLEEQSSNCWLALVKPGRRLKPGVTIEFSDSLTAIVLAVEPDTGGRLLQFNLPDGKSLLQVLPQLGVVPLPPYITHSHAEPEQYQTVYAKHLGSAAAPTAGLHFTPELLDRLQEKGIQQAFITLHVGVGTFRPVEAENITQHKMHSEWLEVLPETIEKIQQTKATGGRVIAVGTTVVRALEGVAQTGTVQLCGKTDLFIYPGYQWRVIDGMITNFHLPKSSLMMLVSALIGRERLLELYQVAIAENYRFYSFGDAMLILPEATLGEIG